MRYRINASNSLRATEIMALVALTNAGGELSREEWAQTLREESETEKTRVFARLVELGFVVESGGGEE